METVELLTCDEEGRAIPGMLFPRELGVARYLNENDRESEHLAYPHKFFKYDEHGQPMPETLVTFLVPDFMCRDGAPDRSALRAVSERMGWTPG